MALEKIPVEENVRQCLGSFLGITLTDANDPELLGDLGLDAAVNDAAITALWSWFRPDRIVDMQYWQLPGWTLGELTAWCHRGLDINEFDRVVDVLELMGTPFETSFKLYDIGVSDANKLGLIRKLQRRFFLYQSWRLDIQPDDINSKTTVFDLIRHVETHLVRQ